MIKKARKFIPLFLIGSLLAEDNGWYMSVGYQIGGTQQFINNKQLLENQNIINSITQSAINIAGPTTGLITLSSQSVIDALSYGVSNTVGNQLEGISNILNQIGKRKDFYSSRQISSISQQIIGLKGSSDPLKAHSSQIIAKLLSNTQSAFDQGIALSTNIISSINSLNPSNNAKEVKAQLQSTVQSMAELLQQIEHSITKTTSTTYAQSLLSNLTDAVNASSNNTTYVSALVNALNTLGVGVFPTTTPTHVVLNPPGQIVFYPANSILGSTSSNSNNQQQYNNTLLMNTLQGELSANNQNNPNGCANQVQCLEQFIQNLAPLAATPTSNNQANQQVQAIAQKLQSVAINTLDNNAINNTTYNLNNLHNALNFQAYESTIEQYNNALKQISWISFAEPKNLLKNTSNNYQIGTVTNAQGQNISAYDCTSATGSLSNDASSGISCSATSSTSSTSSFDNSLVATSKIQTIGGKEQIGVNSFNLVSQVWSVYNSLKTSEANLQKNANILCANGAQSGSGTSSCNSSSGGLSISGNAQLQNILSSTSGTTTNTQAKSNASKLKAMVMVNNEEEAKTTNLAQSSGPTTQSPNSTVMGALNAVLQNVNNFQQNIQNAFQNQESNIQAWANAIYNTNGSQSQEMTANNNQNLRIQLRANFYQLINTINQQVPTNMSALINQSQQAQQTSGATNNNNACASGTNGSGSNWCYQQWSDSKAYYSGLQSALGYQTQATTQSGSNGGNSITYNVQQITLTSNGLLNNIISSLKSFSSGGNNGGSSGNGTSQINTAYQMLTDASDGKLGTYSSSNSGNNNGYTPCNSTNGNNGTSNCYTPNKQQNTTTATTNENNNLQKVYNDAQKIANIIASSGNNKGVENGLKQFFEALKNNSNSLSNLCNGSSGTTCTGGLINLLGAIPTNGVSDTNNLINLLTEFIKTAGFIQNNDNSVSTSLTSAFQAITSAISQGFQALQNDISPNAILTLLQEITSNTTTIQSFSQTLRQLLGDKTFFMVQQKLIDAMINARNQVQNTQNQANNYGSQPVLSQYVAAKSTQHGMSNGLGVGLGYKYFFGKARKLGLRHYFFFDYGFSEIGLANQSVKANIFAYGVGTDFLWNLFRRTYNTKALNFGLFAGVQLGGATWLSSLRQQIIDNWGNANDIHSTNFQVALNFGVRTNFAEFKRFAKKFHNQGVISQKSVEFGIKVPLINQAYLNSAGADVSYRRLYTFYINYIMGF
ncbi:Hop family outer membrane protein HopL [Helicobacter pylori]|uniref:Hop family outer membrane protein HopL n=1 Tax=Helicobacter pylori TaxID=210 RepID=UPI0003D7A02B|nr:Hop family outer membrane protein HopL [Helicobacter pylori]WRC61368.1 Hop family outer membrane protein HopL [Helicobacter pylori]